MLNNLQNTPQTADAIFRRAIADYHRADDVDHPEENPFAKGSPEALLYAKAYTDSIQWHLEDIIRDPDIDPARGMQIKHRIDALNQHRTDIVEQLDSLILDSTAGIEPRPDARLNTESPAWALDRLSILNLKIWHMQEQASRTDAPQQLRLKAEQRLETLLAQHTHLLEATASLLADITRGQVRMHAYFQMKLYNDPATNPALYGKK